VVITLLLKVRVNGLERIPAQGAIILAINHVNSLDAFVLRSVIQRDIIAWAKAELWNNPLLRLLAETMEFIPLRRGKLDLRSVRLALRALERGKMIGVAPEGTRSWHGRLQRGRPGIVFLTQYAPDTLILPGVVYGQERFRHHALRLRRTPVNVVFGQGFRLNLGEGKVTRELRQVIVDEIMAQIAALLPPEYRDVYSDLAAFNEHHLRFPPGTTSSLQATLDREMASGKEGEGKR
jgi:1-acyl-sn-glycerol-3-phosphate acyltransferase